MLECSFFLILVCLKSQRPLEILVVVGYYSLIVPFVLVFPKATVAIGNIICHISYTVVVYGSLGKFM